MRKTIEWVGLFVCLVGSLLVMQAAAGVGDISFHLLRVDVGFVAGLSLLSEIFRLAGLRGRQAWLVIGLIGTTALTGLYVVGHTALTAWMLIIAAYALLVWLDRTVGSILFRRRLGRWITRSILAMAGGFLPGVVSQIESRFADEEFFVAVQGIELAGFCLLFLAAQAYAHRNQGEAEKPTHKHAVAVSGFVAAMIGLGVWGGVAYQNSFYTSDVPGYPGVTGAYPSLCGQVMPDPGQPSGQDVYQRLLTHIEANPRQGVPELGMLALGTGELEWADAFRDAIMAEARDRRFAEPDDLGKFAQRQAALRAYYASQVRAAFPDLFSGEDWEALRAWFAAINGRALTVEPVDWLYAVAFSKRPEGPYENQENGAGLLAILEAGGLSPPDLSPINQDYLERNRGGWTQRFHNTDDVFFYQSEWITNAYYQSLYWQENGDPDSGALNRQLSSEWMLLQALPDGAPLSYNHPARPLPAGTAYLAATMEHDPQFVWWAGRMLDWATANGAALYAQPGVENAVNLQGMSPTAGSCLIYSDSGLPNQPGPLAPDKIVFRDGWTPDAAYMLLNLRFSGWHRYKATNGVVLLYQDGPIVVEKSNGDSFSWLPTGRQLFRDKRVPRENLNGLLIPRTGWAQVVHRLTGIGSDWAQDPPPLRASRIGGLVGAPGR